MMENIILIGHGSPKKDANNIELTGRLLHSAIHPNCNNNCVKVAYLQFAEPGIADAIKECVLSGAKRIIIHPYFLSSGIHVTKDIPEIIKEAKDMYPDREFIYTEPLGIHEKLVHVVMERIHTANGLKPHDIEKRSFEIISEEADLSDMPPEQLPIIKRVIHATADFEFKNTLMFHPDAIRTGIDAIKAGKNILTDVEMVKTGIIKRWLEPYGGKVICNINDEDVVRLSKDTGKTRSEIAIKKALQANNNIGIIAIGNAPTALLKVIEMLNSPIHPFTHSPILVVGVPVGFVKALESKALLAAQKFPFITNLSRKGGTPVAVAIINALLKVSKERL
ncbi:precorrin-8X methylmutase [Dissulfurispira sp.]|uniref:precorrin-8X methylmutase n=1 Tax=Dissulfurispira sp. TaxID=2817609 RepID=UPI002FD8D496